MLQMMHPVVTSIVADVVFVAVTFVSSALIVDGEVVGAAVDDVADVCCTVFFFQ